MTILIKGAGIAGLVLAHELAEAGHAVVLADLAPAPGAGASRLAGGMLASYCEGETAPCEVVRLGTQAISWWQRIMPGHVIRKGTLVVAQSRDAGEISRFASRTANHVLLDEAALAEMEPDLAGRFSRALFFPEEAHLDPRAVMAALCEKLVGMGVVLLTGEAAAAICEQPGPFRAEIDCIGKADIGPVADLRGVRGEMMLVACGDVHLSRPVRLLHPRIPLYIVPRRENHFMIGATMIESEDDGPVSARSVMELLNAAYALHPAFGEARLIETGAGIRPAFPDNIPRFSHTGGNRYRLNGFYRHGFLLAPALAREAVAAFGGQA